MRFKSDILMLLHPFLLCFIMALLAVSPASAQVFLEVDFNGGALPAGWSTEDASGNGVEWEGCSGLEDCGLAGLPPVLARFGAASAANGFVGVNSDAAGTLPGNGHISRLASAPIDCSGKDRVFLQFQSAIGTANRNPADNAVLRVRSAIGTGAYRPFSMLEKNNRLQLAPIEALADGEAYVVTLDISQFAANQPGVTLEWEWRGNFEFAWLIDDIRLSTRHPARPDEAVYFESFSNGANGWSAIPTFPPDSLWKWTPRGDVSNGFGISFAEREAFIHAPGANDGAMAFNADFYNTGGELPGQGPLLAFVCELVSPPIDLSEVAHPLALQFYQLGWLGNIAGGAPQTPSGARFITSFAYSTDGGNSWSPPINVNPYQTPVTSSNFLEMPPFNNQPYFALPEVEGSSDFRLKFTWAGDFYFWVLDDIALVERKPHDMKANRNFFAVMPNAVTPVSQLREEALLCDVVNVGAETAEEVKLEAVVRRKGNPAVLYADTLFYGDIPVDSLVENVFFNRRLEPDAIAQPGDYEAFYAVSHDQPDGRPRDDTLRWRFRVSDYTFAKEFGPTRDIAPSESRSYTYGNLFYVPRGAGFYACAASFGIANTAQLANLGEGVTLFLNKWNGDLNEDGLINPDEYEFVAFNSYEFSEFDGPGLIHLPISVDNKGKMLEDDTYYMVVVQYESLVLSCFMLASDTIDYQATWFANDSLGHQQYASVLDVGNTGTFSTIGFGYDIVPVVRLHLGTNEDCLVATEEAAAGSLAPLLLSPNPAGERVLLELSARRAYSNATITIMGLSGRIVQREQLGDIPGHSLEVGLSQLPEGVYVVKFQSEEFSGAGKLVVQR